MNKVWLLCGLWAGIAGAATIELDSPRGGWNRSGLTDQSQEQAVAYPQPPIDRGAQKYRSVIRGHIDDAGKGRKPPQLIVNGNAMPLYTDDAGGFARPYALGPGSNSVEIRSSDGRTRKRVQFYEANRQQTKAHIRIILAWDDNQAEVDMHVITPDGQHAFFGQPVLSNGGGLDVDSVDGAGPEMFSMTAPLPGVYHVYVNYWGNFNAGGYHFDESTQKKPVITTTLTLIHHENTLREKRETFVVPLRRIGDLNHVRSFRFP